MTAFHSKILVIVFYCMCYTDLGSCSSIQRRVVRQVEVPFTRQVKVPVKTRQIVPVVVQKKVVS